jgi:hypothetical protein
MDGTSEFPLPAPANENADPLRRADVALAELYRLRRELLAADTTGRPLSWWQARREALAKFEEAVRLCLEHL